MPDNVQFKISHEALELIALGLALFVVGFALHFLVEHGGVIDRYIASPLAACGLGLFGGMIWRQRKNISPKARLTIVGVVTLFILAWIVHIVTRI